METIFENPKLESFFIGTLLGDSYIHNGVFYCKLISQDLINFKVNFIKENLPDAITKIDEHNEYTDKNGVHHQKFWILSMKHNKVKELYKIFYKDGKKIYPKGSVSKLDDVGFSMWYADDGTTILVQVNKLTCLTRARRVQICTDNFTYDEHLLIKEEMELLGYGIKCIDRKRNGQFRTQINKNKQKFICMLENTFMNFPSLLYKLDLGYRYSSLNTSYVSEEYKNCYKRISAHPQFIDRVKEKLSLK